MDVLMLFASVAIPWLLGIALLRLIPEHTEPRYGTGSLAWSLGYGWFVGAFVLTLWMRALSLAGVKFGFAVVALPLAVAASIALAILWRRDGHKLRGAMREAGRTLGGSGYEGLRRAAWFALLAWLGLRFALLLFENVERPLYAWDAWTHWATKARVWFELKSIVPFVSANEWMQATDLAYTDYNPHYPGTLPLLQVWGALALGRWDDTLVNLPWWICSLALALAIYGFLAQRALGALTALLGAWLVISLPILDTHVALAGYADLPLAAYFSLSGLALWRWTERRGWDDAFLFVLLACACALIKNPGRVWVVVMIPAVIAGLVPRYGVRIALACLGAAVMALLVLARTNLSLLGYQLTLGSPSPWEGLVDAYLLYGNWHLLWYCALVVALLGWRQLLAEEFAPLTVLLASSMLFLLFGFAFTNAGAWVEDQSTVNRATLPVAPLLVAWMVVVYQAWTTRIPQPPQRTPERISLAPAIPEFKRLAEARSALGTELSADIASPPAATLNPAADGASGAESTQAPVPANTPPGAGSETAMPVSPSQKSPEMDVPAVGRNDPCPCGSGKRYKHCHGAVSSPSTGKVADATEVSPQEELFMRAIAAHQRGDVETAERDYRAALALAPDHIHASHYLGVALYQRGRVDEALPLLEQAVERIPQEPEFHNNLGLALVAANRSDDAIAAYRRALALKPDHAAAWNNLGLLQAKGNPAAAVESYRSALRFAPNFAEAHNNLGNTLKDLNRLDDAVASYDRALAIKPDLAEACVNRGLVLLDLKRTREALASFDRALILSPDYDFLGGTYLGTKMQLCDWSDFDESLARFEADIAARKRVTMPLSALSLTDNPELHLIAAQVYAAAKDTERAGLGPIPRRADGNKIRVGYFSADFREHPVSFQTVELFELHDRERFEVYGFSFGPSAPSEIRQRLAATFDQLIDVGDKSDREIAQLARDLGIDIAIDLGGHTRDARTGIFIERPAPIQATYLGYPGTSGAPFIDYIIADRVVLPEDSQAYYTEKVVYLPHSFLVSDSTRRISDRVFSKRELGLPEQGFVYCCFNNNYKILPATFDGWMRVLKAVDGSVLWLQAGNPEAAGNLRKEAERRGVDGSRLAFAHRMELMDEHLARYRWADVFLDTIPYNAHSTASDALWAGLPVVTCPGRSFASRVAASLLNAIELPELILRTQDEYEAKAIELALSPSMLSEVRRKLERNRATTPLFDTERFARHLEAAYAQMFTRYRAGMPPANINVPSE